MPRVMVVLGRPRCRGGGQTGGPRWPNHAGRRSRGARARVVADARAPRSRDAPSTRSRLQCLASYDAGFSFRSSRDLVVDHGVSTLHRRERAVRGARGSSAGQCQACGSHRRNLLRASARRARARKAGGLGIPQMDGHAAPDHRMGDQHRLPAGHRIGGRRAYPERLLCRAFERPRGARSARLGGAVALVAEPVPCAKGDHGSSAGRRRPLRRDPRRAARPSAARGALAMKPAHRAEPYWMLAPTLALLGLFFLYPLFVATKQSLYSWDLLTPAKYVGFANYQVLWERGELWRAFRNTLVYSSVVVAGSMTFGLAFALALDRPGKVAGFVRSAVFSAYVVSWVAVALLFMWLLDSEMG